MPLPIYLAMTMAEMHNCDPLPEHCAYMGCTLSSGGNGLSGIPSFLPNNAILTVNDSMPPHGHDASFIAEQLQEAVTQLRPGGVLLDFQRPYNSWLGELCMLLCHSLNCPVAVTPIYEEWGSEYLFLPPIQPDQEIESYFRTRKGKKYWLELSAESLILTLNENGCLRDTDLPPLSPFKLHDKNLYSHYEIRITDHEAIFHLHRTCEDQRTLLEACSQYGVTAGIALYQEACSICPVNLIDSHRPQ